MKLILLKPASYCSLITLLKENAATDFAVAASVETALRGQLRLAYVHYLTIVNCVRALFIANLISS